MELKDVPYSQRVEYTRGKKILPEPSVEKPIWLDKEESAYLSIQGEGATIGHPTVFVRFKGCNLRCFALVPGRRIPKITTSVGPNKRITEIKVGDKLIATADNGELVETTVVEVFDNKTTEYYRVDIEGKPLLFATAEHPWKTSRGWVLTKDLRIGDEIFHITGNQKISFQKLNDNPMWRGEVVAKRLRSVDYQSVGRKVSRTRRRLFARGELPRLEGEQNGNWKGGGAKYDFRKAKLRVYERDGLACQKCQRTKGLLVHHIDFDKTNNELDNLVTLCHQCHALMHGFNVYPERVKNGLKVCGLKLLTNEGKPRSWRRDPVRILNFRCEPYDNYFIEYLNVHNCSWCDSKHSAYTVENRVELTVQEAFDLIHGFECRVVDFTGGEPMLFATTPPFGLRELARKLKEAGHWLQIETNGTLYDQETWDLIDLWSVSPKLDGSGESNWDGVPYLIDRAFVLGEDVAPSRLQFKFVVCNDKDLDLLVDRLSQFPLIENSFHFILQPDGGSREDECSLEEYQKRSKWLVEAALKHHGLQAYRWRVIPQFHKIIWGSGTKKV